jgi:hypothetical protein
MSKERLLKAWLDFAEEVIIEEWWAKLTGDPEVDTLEGKRLQELIVSTREEILKCQNH